VPPELEDEGALEPLLEEPPPHPASTVASNKLPRSAVLVALEPRHAPRLTALGRLFNESGTAAVDIVRAPVKTKCPGRYESALAKPMLAACRVVIGISAKRGRNASPARKKVTIRPHVRPFRSGQRTSAALGARR
jgi:hypothetical protein